VELLVMDDASTDATPEILAAYGSRLMHVRQPKTRGIYGNANDGIAMARGEYVAIYHADDVYEPTIVERGVSLFRAYPEVGAVFCKDVFIDAFGRQVGRLALPPEVGGGGPLSYAVVLNALLKYQNRFLRCPTAMVRASVYRTVGGYRDTEFFNTSDLEMWLRIARQYPIAILDEYLLRYRRGHDSSSRRYHHLRTDPGRHFQIMDLYLREGGRELATQDSLAAHEAHRAEDTLLRAVNLYILGQTEHARRVVNDVRMWGLLGSPMVQRYRLLALLLVMHVFTRLPRMPLAAQLFYQRWHASGPRARRKPWAVVPRQRGLAG
jgi:glycosyltransferase involved in cell wall biosynthesis